MLMLIPGFTFAQETSDFVEFTTGKRLEARVLLHFNGFEGFYILSNEVKYPLLGISAFSTGNKTYVTSKKKNGDTQLLRQEVFGEISLYHEVNTPDQSSLKPTFMRLGSGSVMPLNKDSLDSFFTSAGYETPETISLRSLRKPDRFGRVLFSLATTATSSIILFNTFEKNRKYGTSLLEKGSGASFWLGAFVLSIPAGIINVARPLRFSNFDGYIAEIHRFNARKPAQSPPDSAQH
jgi:hypothetical protein